MENYDLKNKNIPVILANGEFPYHHIPIKILTETEFLICTDGSLNSLLKFKNSHKNIKKYYNIEPKLIIGDGDSISPQFKKKYKNIYIEYSEQDNNDLTKTTIYCLNKGYNKIIYLGIGGKRDDHAIANFSLLMRYYAQFNIQLIAYTNYGYFIPFSGKKTFKSKKGQQISIFNFNCKNLSSDGLKWNIYSFNELWQGTLNEAISDKFTINADANCIVFMNYI